MPDVDEQTLREKNQRLREEIDRLKLEVTTLEGAVASKEEVLFDLWGHKAYLIGRKRLTRFLATMVTIVGLLGAAFFFDVYRKISTYVEGEMKTNVTAQAERIVATSKLSIDESVRAAQATAKEFQNDVAALRKETEQANREARNALEASRIKADELLASINKDAERLSQLARANASDRLVVSTSGPDGPQSSSEVCPPLGPDARRAIDIKRVVDEGSIVGTRRVVTNTLSVDVLELGSSSSERTALETCFINSIDRVVYTLDDRWFAPSEVVRANPADRFRTSVRVWGPLAVKATIYFSPEAKGETSPLVYAGNFSTITGTCHLGRQAQCVQDDL